MIGINCSSCGKFVGTDGRIDVGYDPYSGCMEAGYPLCGKCLREEEARIEKYKEMVSDEFQGAPGETRPMG